MKKYLEKCLSKQIKKHRRLKLRHKKLKRRYKDLDAAYDALAAEFYNLSRS
jgi:hypothetical protein